MIKVLSLCFGFVLLSMFASGCARNGNADISSEQLNPSQNSPKENPQNHNRYFLSAEDRRFKYSWDHEKEEFEQRIQKAVKLIKKYDHNSSVEIDEDCLRFGEWHLIVFKPEDHNKGILDLNPDYQHSRAYIVDMYNNKVIPKNGWKEAHSLYHNIVTFYQENQANLDKSFYHAVAQITSAIAFHHNAFVALDDPNGEAFKMPRFIPQDSDMIFDYYVLNHHELQHYQLLISHDRIQFNLLSTHPWPVKQ